MLAYLYFPTLKYSATSIAVSATVLIVTLFGPYFETAFALFGSYLAIKVAFTKIPILRCLTARGDLSYGLYIYAFPVQQSIVHFWGQYLNWIEVFGISLTISLMLASASWHFIEMPALRLKKKTMGEAHAS
jgi:peptidoglycan/LPS O-acetylase OafA/YrhL